MNTKRYIAMGLLLFAATSAVVAQEEQEDATPSLIGSQIKIENQSSELTSTNMTVSMDLNLDNLKMRSDQRIILTPMLKGEDNNMVFMPQIVINGRRQDIEYKRKGHKVYDEDIVEVRRYNGKEQTVHYSTVFSTEDWMQNSDIVINEDLCGCGNILANNEVPIWSMRTPVVAFMRPEAAPKTHELKGTAYIDFPVNKITLYPDYHRNPSELQKIISTIDKVKEDNNITIDKIDICGFASPEDTYAHNTYLAENRAQTLKDYVRNLVNIDDSIFTVSFVPENWDGLRTFVEGSTLEHKSEILSIIEDNDLAPDPKEKKIKSTYPKEYAYMLSEYYPWLRRSDYTIDYTIRPFSVDEAKEIFKTNPGQLSMEEMYLVAQTYEPDSEEFHEIFATAVHLFPNDPTANLNAACIEIERGDYAAAEKYLAKAGDNPYVWNAQGVVASKTGDMTEAKALFQKASDAGLETATSNLNNLSREY